MDDQSKDFFLRIGSKIDVLHEITTDVRLVLAAQEITTKQHTDILDKLSTTTANLQMISAQQELNLQKHMARTAINEQRLEAFDQEVRPILEGFRFVKKIGTFAVGLAAVIKAISMFWK